MNAVAMERATVPDPDPSTHCSLAWLQQGLAKLPRSPRDMGRVRLLCSRIDDGTRWLPHECRVDPEAGIAGDRWLRNRAAGQAKYGELYADMQIATMEVGVAELIANGQPLWLFGDNLFLDLDLSTENLPPESVLEAGQVQLRVTSAPHDGCKKFNARFGADALRFAADRTTRSRNLRGIYLRVTRAGSIAVGDEVRVVSRSVRVSA